MAELGYTIEIHTDYSNRDWCASESASLESAKVGAKELDSGDMVGEVIKWQRADGYAQYMVTSQTPLTIAHVYIGDGYQIEDALVRGLNEDDIRAMVERERAIKELFKS